MPVRAVYTHDSDQEDQEKPKPWIALKLVSDRKILVLPAPEKWYI